MNKLNSLDSFATPMAAKNHFIKASFGGFAGSGKSRTATEMVIGAYRQLGCTKPVLVIDNEKGARFLKTHFDKAGIDARLKETVNLADIMIAIRLLNERQIDFLFIDSLSKVWYKYIQDFLKKINKTTMTLQYWGMVIPQWQEQFANAFVEAEGNIIFTGRGGNAYEKEDDEHYENGQLKKKGQFVKSGVKMKVQSETAFEPDLNIWMEQKQITDSQGNIKEVAREAFIMKDRSGIIDGKSIINPTYADFKPVVDFICSTPTGTVAGATSNDPLVHGEEEFDRKKDQRVVLKDRMKASFVKMGLSSRNGAQAQLIAVISESIYGSPSSEVVMRLQTPELEEGTKILEVFAQWYKDNSGGDGFGIEQVEEKLLELNATQRKV